MTTSYIHPTKACTKCQVVKTLNSFYKHSGTKDKYRSTCVNCWKLLNKKTPEQNKAYRLANLDRLREQDRNRRNTSQAKKEKASYDRIYRKVTPEKQKERQLKRDFGISYLQFKQMLEKQANVCAICKQFETKRNKQGTLYSLAVDHCHKTGKVRGLLCHNCNGGMGLFRDNPWLLLKCADYLTKEAK